MDKKDILSLLNYHNSPDTDSLFVLRCWIGSFDSCVGTVYMDRSYRDVTLLKLKSKFGLKFLGKSNYTIYSTNNKKLVYHNQTKKKEYLMEDISASSITPNYIMLLLSVKNIPVEQFLLDEKFHNIEDITVDQYEYNNIKINVVMTNDNHYYYQLEAIYNCIKNDNSMLNDLVEILNIIKK